MRRINCNTEAFLALLRAGLWEQNVNLAVFESIDFSEIYRLAQEQSVVGLVAAGLEHVVEKRVPQAIALTFAGDTLQLEQRNLEMNLFVGVLFEKMRLDGINALLVKGQGIAQCYERPLWRACGDIDILLDYDNYVKANALLTPLATTIEKEHHHLKHKSFIIDSWVVELHGTLRSELGARVDGVIDEIQKDTFENNKKRNWHDGDVIVGIPEVNNDVIFVFTHILQHFFIGGIGLRQIGDLCRLIWMYRNDIDHKMLEYRLRGMGIMSEWKVFAAFAVGWLGMPEEAMPHYDSGKRWKRQAEIVLKDIIKAGNFGHNRDLSHQKEMNTIVRKLETFCYFTKFSLQHAMLFPASSLRVWLRMVKDGLKFN